MLPPTFKIAKTQDEFDQIAQQIHDVFVKEIPRYQPTAPKRVVDKFHHENTYIICKSGHTLTGMLAIKSQRPFSLDQTIPDLDEHLPAYNRICEIRLLSIKKDLRRKRIFHGLMRATADYCTRNDFDIAIISGYTSQLPLYRHLGFVPFASLIGTDAARFQPMYITQRYFSESIKTVGDRT